MKRLLPAPLTSLVLLAVWLLINNTLQPGQVLLGALLALAIPVATRRLRGPQPRVRRAGSALKLAARVAWDILVSNVEVARRILGREAALRPGFVWVPLAISDPHGIAALAGIVTLTPGTLSADLSPDRRHLLVHALHLPDPQAMVDTIKRRYEAPLLEIFP